MPTFNLSNKIKIVNPVANIDDDYGPYNSIGDAETAIPSIIRKGGKTVGILESGKVVEYWWEDDTATILVKKVLPFTSTTLNINRTIDNEISIEIPVVSEIPALIVNSAYTGTEELGTASKPFKTIQGALDAYKGTGGKGTILDISNPQKLGSIIQIEKGVGAYNFTGDFDYKDVKLSLKAGAVIDSTPTGNWLMDFTKFSTTTTHNPEITFEQGAYIYCNKNGFKIVGGNFTAPTSNRKSLTVGGSAKRTGLVLVGTNESHILFEVNGGGETFANGGYQNLIISTFISTNRGKLFSIKGNGVVSCEDILTFILNDSNGAVITTTNPIIELDGTAALYYINSQIQVNRTPTVTYKSLVSIASTSSALFEARDSTFTGFADYFVYNSNTARTATVRLDACKMYIDTGISFAGTVSGVWGFFYLTNNNMPNTSINLTTTTILPSAINTIGGNVVETLPYYNSRTLAISAGLPYGGKFINMKSTGDSSLWTIDIIVDPTP
jgi:hypothetical protein